MTKTSYFPLEKATAVVPAYNEEQHIARLLGALRPLTEIDQIVVVDDGSVDKTAAVVEKLRREDGRIELLRLPHNQGKGAALRVGAEASHNDLLVLLDADLIGVQPRHVRALLKPVRQQRCGMTVGVFQNGRSRTDLSHRLTPFLSGQRCLRWSLFRATPALDDAHWGIEVAFHLHAWQQGYGMQHVPWRGVTHPMRTEKIAGPPWAWVRSYCGTYWDVVKYCLRHVTWRSLIASFRSRAAPARAGEREERARRKRRVRYHIDFW